MVRPRKSYAFFILKHVFRSLLSLLLFAVIAFLCWRVFLAPMLPREMKRLSPNAALKAAYDENGGALTLQYQEQGTVSRGENDRGYFGVPRFVYIKEAHQLQVVLRYNNQTLDRAAERFSLDEKPPRGEWVFEPSLLLLTDLTPDDKSDNQDGGEQIAATRYAPTSYRFETTALYTYCLLTFDDVTFGEDALVAYLDLYFDYAGITPDYEKAPFGTLRLYHAESEWLPLSFNKSDAARIAAFTEN